MLLLVILQNKNLPCIFIYLVPEILILLCSLLLSMLYLFKFCTRKWINILSCSIRLVLWATCWDAKIICIFKLPLWLNCSGDCGQSWTKINCDIFLKITVLKIFCGRSRTKLVIAQVNFCDLIIKKKIFCLFLKAWSWPNSLVECTNTLWTFTHNQLLETPPQSFETHSVSVTHYMKYCRYFYSHKPSVVT